MKMLLAVTLLVIIVQVAVTEATELERTLRDLIREVKDTTERTVGDVCKIIKSLIEGLPPAGLPLAAPVQGTVNDLVNKICALDRQLPWKAVEDLAGQLGKALDKALDDLLKGLPVHL